MQFIDIHSHILFGVDDGSENLDYSLSMLRQAADFNVEHIMATPHATEVMTEEIGTQFIVRYNRLKTAAESDGIPVGISLGTELFFSERILEWLEEPWATFNGLKKYLLFELPLFEIPENVDEFIFRCRMSGTVPVMAHPERYLRLHDAPDRILKWYHHGCLMQLNAGSLMGQFGERIRNFSRRLLESGMYQFLASDAHDLNDRNFEILTRAALQVEEFMSREYAEILCHLNPGKALRGEKVDTGNPIEIIEDKSRFNRFFKKLFAVRAS